MSFISLDNKQVFCAFFYKNTPKNSLDFLGLEYEKKRLLDGRLLFWLAEFLIRVFLKKVGFDSGKYSCVYIYLASNLFIHIIKCWMNKKWTKRQKNWMQSDWNAPTKKYHSSTYHNKSHFSSEINIPVTFPFNFALHFFTSAITAYSAFLFNHRKKQGNSMKQLLIFT